MTGRTFSTIFLALTAWLPAAADSKWTLYQSFNGITEITPAGSMAFALASGNMFSYDITTGETRVYNKANGLSDSGIAATAWCQTARRLVVAYSDGNIDLVGTDESVTNVPDLYSKVTTLDKTINHISVDGQYAYISLGFGVMKLDVKRGLVMDTYQLGFNVDYSYVRDGYVYAASRENGLYRGRQTDNLLDKSAWERAGDYTPLVEDRLNVQAGSKNLWWTTNSDGKLTYYTVAADGSREYQTEGILPDGPSSNHFYRLYVHGGKLYATGGVWTQELDGCYPGVVHVWDGKAWSQFEQPTAETLGHGNVDYICMDFDPRKEGHVMVGAKSGLYEFQDGQFVKCYNTDNSPIKTSGGTNPEYAMATGVKYDADGNLWVLNRRSDTPLLQLSPDGEWKKMAHAELKNDNSSSGNLVNMLISRSNGYMWFINDYWIVNKVYAYDYANDKLYTIGGPKFTNGDGTEVTPNYVQSMAEDRDGNLWLATSSGPLYLSPSDIQAGNGMVTQHKVPRNDGTNLADYLLDNIDTRCVAFDGGNRKWIGSSSGVFLISADCNTQIEHFTADNSPLLSNTVNDIAVDPNSNTVYFATDRGLCSYASDATSPSDEMSKDNVYAYPNPVRPDYTGMITVVGLSYNADVKIVTSNGVLVNQGRSTGGSYQWDGCDLKGRRVASGVYMVEAAKEDGSKGTVCKIAVVN